MSSVSITIRILLEGEPELSFLRERIIERYKFCFSNVDFELIRLGSKSRLLSEETLLKNYIKLDDPNFICIFLPDYHPTTSHNLDHSSLNSLRNDIYNKIERIASAHNIPDYKERFLIHFFKHGGDVVFLTNLEILFEEIKIDDEDYINEIKICCNAENLEDLQQDPEKESQEKRLLKSIFKKAGKSYTVKNLRNLIKKLKIEDLINRLPHFKLFLKDLFKFAEYQDIPETLKELLDI